MNVEYFLNKTYEIPLKVPQKNVHKYLEIINLGYAKYLDIIFKNDGMIMNGQFYQIVKELEGQHRTERSNTVIAQSIIQRLTTLGFIKTQYISSHKFIYLRHPAASLVLGDYKSTVLRINRPKDYKNDRFQVAILKNEYFIKCKEIIHNQNMMNQLILITKTILNTINSTGNKFGYATDCIEHILTLNDYFDIKNYLYEHPEYEYKLDIVRSLWDHVGFLYRNFILQRHTVSNTPEYLKIYSKKETGQIILHYIPTIIIFDMFDFRFYREKINQLFHAFYGIPGNDLRGTQNHYLKTNKSSMGFEQNHHIGYKIHLIGSDIDVLNKKKEFIDENINSSLNSPHMDYTSIQLLDTTKYFLHASRKINPYTKKQEERLEKIIATNFSKLNLKEQKTNNSSLNILNLVKD